LIVPSPEKPCLAGERNGPLIPRKRNVDELTGGHS